MMERLKIKKIFAVVFLTVLIWVWSDLALDETADLSQIPVMLGNSSDPNLLVSFVDDAELLTDRIVINTVSIKGPVAAVEQMKARERTNSLDLHLVLEPDKWELTEPMDAPAWSLVNFVKRSPAIDDSGLSIDSCVPRTASIRVMRLAKRSLVVQCVDQNRSTIPAQITPSTIQMYVPEAWPEDRLVADVELSAIDLNRAQSDIPIDLIPFVDISGRIKRAKQSVKVRLSESVTNLTSQVIENPKFCLVVDPIIQRDYKIVISREVEALRRILFKGTNAAKRAYQNEPYHVELVVERDGSQSAILKYRFPREYVEKNQLKPDDSPLDTIDFKLVPRASSSENGNAP
ncbi:MAG: hypothetical protein GY809_22815 [Planctomycetes bacterium]|nr:hypothetical protein [Planctomycetota bacterium]